MSILFWGLTSKLCPPWHKEQWWWWWWWWWLECSRPYFLPHFCYLPTPNTLYRKNRKIAIHLKLSTILEILFSNYIVFCMCFLVTVGKLYMGISKIEVVTVILQEAMVLEIKATIICIVLPFRSILTMLVMQRRKRNLPKSALLIKPVAFITILFPSLLLWLLELASSFTGCMWGFHWKTRWFDEKWVTKLTSTGTH